jgi:hypothetical protein
MWTINLKDSKCLEYGINIHNLKAGITVLTLTRNSLYKIIKGSRDQYDISIQGGKHFREPTNANFSGSTFGGSMIKIGWIGYGMYMEFFLLEHRKNYKTTPVQAARVIGPGWEYDMEWEDMGISTKPKIA